MGYLKKTIVSVIVVVTLSSVLGRPPGAYDKRDAEVPVKDLDERNSKRAGEWRGGKPGEKGRLVMGGGKMPWLTRPVGPSNSDKVNNMLNKFAEMLEKVIVELLMIRVKLGKLKETFGGQDGFMQSAYAGV